MSRRTPCCFHQLPGGCRKGDSCSFLHTGPSGGSLGSPAHSVPAIRSPLPGLRATSETRTTTRAPPGVCNEFWTLGRCGRNFDCRYRHEHQTRSGSEQSSRTRPSLISPRVSAPLKLDAAQVHNHLGRFLKDDYRFKTPHDIYAFIGLLRNATEENNWTVEDGQLLLTTLATAGKNGLLRLGDIVRHSDVSPNAGPSANLVSFQRAYLPLLAYLSSDFVVKSAVHHNVNALYALVHNDLEVFAKTIQTSMDNLMSARSFQDPRSSSIQPGREVAGSYVFTSLSTVLFEYLTRFRHVVIDKPTLAPLVHSLHGWLEEWIYGINSIPPTFEDVWASKATPEARSFITTRLRDQVGRVVTIVDREQGVHERHALDVTKRAPVNIKYSEDMSVLAYLDRVYIGPGEERAEGPRHDNDFTDILQIRIAPTHDELICSHPPFLPANIPNAPHHLPPGSMERLLDIQFRLLREEFIAPLRTAIRLILQDLRAPLGTKTRLTTLVGKRGGRYISNEDQDSIMFNVYTNCRSSRFQLNPYRGVTVEMSLDSPPGSARSPNSAARSNFWEGKGGKRLMQGGLVALIWGTGDNASVYVGIVASPLKDLAISAKLKRDERVDLQVSFFDPQAELRILQAIKNSDGEGSMSQMLVEAPVMFESIRPFLDALRVEPTSIPFSRYLTHPLSGSLENIRIDPPRYATHPGFSFDLRCLFKTEPPETLRLTVTESSTADVCRQELRAHNSRLDASQADAVVDALTREVALIQGPPGTGKTYIGVEILRTLLLNQVRPILMIAFTNHALDHMLSSVLDAGITKNIIRLGSRSADERISKFNLDNMEMLQEESLLKRSLNSQFKILKETQRDMDRLMHDMRTTSVTGVQMEQYIEIQYADHYESLDNAPAWVAILRVDLAESLNWETVGAVRSDGSQFTFWENGEDLKFLAARKTKVAPQRHRITTVNRFDALDGDREEPLEEEPSEEESEDTDPPMVQVGCASSWIQTWPAVDDTLVPNAVFGANTNDQAQDQQDPRPSSPTESQDIFVRCGLDGQPEVPATDRPLNQLLMPCLEMWGLSKKERVRLSRYWRDEVRRSLAEEQLRQFSRFRANYETARVRYNEIKDQSKLRLLKGTDIVGCTTTGAAKLSSLLKGFSPKILLVEEAGQVLEAHILGSLVPSVEHLILIGDPLQLRPTLANYHLSMDSKRGAKLYRFDMSLMERLSTFDLSMSQLEVQRRMRPSIASLVRESLYPRLQDHDLTKEYSSVRGMAQDIFFMSHEHRETGGGEDSVSKHNTFEVKMIVDLVLHLLRRGWYTGPGDIVVLCAYLGQLIRVRDALASKVVTVIDERDQEALAAHEEEREDVQETFNVEKVSVTKKVLLRTVDNYQGEEATIIILSLVRNSGSIEDEQERAGSAVRSSIGFLKSRNRTNVALSRAKHGLYIMGNAANLASQSPLWKKVIDVLETQGSLGSAFPICCPKHPEEQYDISAPGMIAHYAPDGGCLRSCAEPLRCGHVCPYKCHSDDENHLSISCNQPCLRLCSQGHPCDKLCFQTCGDCQHPILNVPLPCGHIAPSVPCCLANDTTQVKCRELVVRSHRSCEHKFTIPCGLDFSSYKCQEPCGLNLVCCGRLCSSTCGDCQLLNGHCSANEPIGRRIRHKAHPCRRNLFCGHPCRVDCSQDHTCTTRCSEPCRRSCEHASCRQPCHVACAPCAEPCSWACPHRGQCPVPCGSICARLPCDVRCSKVLSCGHQCPSLCGEPCGICILCASAERKKDVVDLIMQTTLEEIVPGDTLDTLILTLTCGHTFTVESLDGVCDLDQFYQRSNDGQWLGLASPATEFRGKPVCPSCRAPITLGRYGRAVKRESLELAERNVASDMSCSLQEVRMILRDFDKRAARDALSQAAAKDAAEATNVTQELRDQVQRAHYKNLPDTKNQPGPVESRCFVLAGGKRKKNIHHVSSPIAASWRSITRPLIHAYSIAVEVASQRPAHVKAYQNAFSTLYRQELLEAAKDPDHAPRRPTEHAMRMARLKLWQPPPRADKRFSVEAVWLSLKIRYLMGELAEARLKVMNEKKKSSLDRFVWAAFIGFIYQSCSRDAKLAVDIAVESESHRQVVSSRLLELRGAFENFRFNAEMRRQHTLKEEERLALLEEAQNIAQDAQRLVDQTRKDYLSCRKGDSKREWLASNFTQSASKILERWKALEKSIKAETFYEAVSLEETTEIVRAFNFTHRGHWYTCPNGHIYVIGECGGASQTAYCPECGEAIGGTGHNLNATNSRATQMEDIARSQGAANSPWAWGRGA